MIRLHKFQAVDALVDYVDDMELEDIKEGYKKYLRETYNAMPLSQLIVEYVNITDPQERVIISDETDIAESDG